MFNTWGKIVQQIRITGLVMCEHSSTSLYGFVTDQQQTYGKLTVSPILINIHPQGFALTVVGVFNLLKSGFSTVSTPPIITKKKDYKEI